MICIPILLRINSRARISRGVVSVAAEGHERFGGVPAVVGHRSGAAQE
jgi:hypothetical protein